MRALILAAGRGKRLRPLTDTIPKPLLRVNGHRLCDWQLAALKRAGVRDVVMNTAHLAQAFESLPQELACEGFRLSLSREGDTEADALESLGGIVHALPLLTDRDRREPFLVLAGDVVHAFDLKRLIDKADDIRTGHLAGHLVAVPNPDFHVKGDMTVQPDGTIVPGAGPHTYACLMIVSPAIFEGLADESAKLFPWLWRFAREGRITAEVFRGFWDNIGSPAEYERLKNNVDALRWARF